MSSFKFLLIVFLGVLMVGAVGYSTYSSDRRAQSDRRQRLERERAVAVLPPGVEDRWIGYVESRVQTAIKPTSGAIVLVDDSAGERH
jgi:hypothetical protein